MASAFDPRAWWEDLKSLPTWGKVLLAVVIVGVIAFALYMRNQSTSTTANTTDTGATGGTEVSTGTGGTDTVGVTGTGSTPSPTPTPPYIQPPPIVAGGGGGGTTVGTTPTARRYVLVKAWPNPGSSLFSIAQANHMSLNQLEADNPQITNPNQVYVGEKVYLDPASTN